MTLRAQQCVIFKTSWVRKTKMHRIFMPIFRAEVHVPSNPARQLKLKRIGYKLARVGSEAQS